MVNLCWSLFKWCLLLTVAVGLAVGGYLYWWLDDEIRRQVEKRLADHYTNLQVDVGRARFEKDHGIAIYDVTLREPGHADAPVLFIEELYLSGNLQVEDLVSDRLRIDEVIVRRATLRAVRHEDGHWNVTGLLPLPQLSETFPVITLDDATLVVDDTARRLGAPQTLRGLDIALTPLEPDAGALPGAERRFRVVGSASGLPARELRVTGEVGTAGDYQLAIQAAGLEVNSEVIAAVTGIEPAQLDGADISGRADLALQLRRDAPSRGPSWSASVALQRGRITHRRLPEPLSEVSLTARADATRLSIERLECRCGPASVVLAGERAGWTTAAPLAAAAKITGLPLNERLQAALPSDCARLWRRFQPAGTVDMEIRVTFDGQKWRPQLFAECRGVSLTDADKFPYRLQQTTGQLEYHPAQPGIADSLRLNLTGIGGGRPVTIVAELSNLAHDNALGSKGPRDSIEPDSPHPRGWVEISGSDVPLHEPLLVALPPRAEALVRSLRPQGAIDFRFRAEWNESSPERADVSQEIRLKDCAIQYERFPYPLRHVAGLVTQRDGIWTIHDVAGRGWNGATSLLCRGTSTPHVDGYRTDLTIEAVNASLDDNLKLALPPVGQQAWDEFRPQGRLDCEAHAVAEPGQPEPRIDAVLRPRDRSVSIEPARFPYRVEQIEGTATYRAGRIEFQNVIGHHDRITYSVAAGAWQPIAGGWEVQLTGVNADRLVPHRDLFFALPPPWQRVLERLQPHGTFGVYNSSLTVAKTPASESLLAAWDIHLDCHRAHLGSEVPLQSVTGGIHLTGRSDGQTTYSAGELALDSLVAKDVQLTNVRGPLWVDATHCLLGEPAAEKQGQPPRPITADAYGGNLTANLSVQHEANSPYTLELALGGANLSRFANERIGGPRDLNGTVSGRLALSGNSYSPQSLRGQGELSVVDANIYELPVLVAMLKVLRNRTPDTTAFNRCDMQFAIQGQDIHFTKLNLLGDAVSLYGKGESNFDRRLDLVFYTLLEPANLPIPFLKTIAGQVSQQALQLKVVGTWDDAEVQPQTLPGFNQVLEQIQAGAATMAPSAAGREAIALPR